MSLQVSISYDKNRLHRNDYPLLNWGFFDEVGPQLLAVMPRQIMCQSC